MLRDTACAAMLVLCFYTSWAFVRRACVLALCVQHYYWSSTTAIAIPSKFHGNLFCGNFSTREFIRVLREFSKIENFQITRNYRGASLITQITSKLTFSTKKSINYYLCVN